MSRKSNKDNAKITQFENESYVDPKGKTLTSSLGVPVSDNQNSLKLAIVDQRYWKTFCYEIN